MALDIRDKADLDHADVVELNFIRETHRYIFRRHFRQGLRSHIMEVLRQDDVATEQRGVLRQGVRWFPAARPLKMLRIFRQRFRDLSHARAEMHTYKLLARYLPAQAYAASSEFLADYRVGDQYSTVLCGLQEYVCGQILDVWQMPATGGLPRLYASMHPKAAASPAEAGHRWMQAVQHGGARLVQGLKAMILQAGHVPDLAGYGNLLVTAEGELKLVDINNISPVDFTPQIALDDKGYPVCDKSIEALALLERSLLQQPIDMHEPQYRWFLDPQRVQDVAALERAFNTALTARSAKENAHGG